MTFTVFWMRHRYASVHRSSCNRIRQQGHEPKDPDSQKYCEGIKTFSEAECLARRIGPRVKFCGWCKPDYQNSH